MSLKSLSVSEPTFAWERFPIYQDGSFRFDPETHLSYVRERIPWSITGALKKAGLIKTDYYTPEGRLRGNHVHSACHYVDDGDLDWEHFEQKRADIVGYARGWEKFKYEWNFIPDLIELPMYADEEHGGLFFAGIPDRAGRILNGEPAIVEIKTGTMMRWTAYQTAGQDLLLRAWEPQLIFRRRFGVCLKPDGTYKKPVEFTRDDEYDHDVFRAALLCAQADGGVDRGMPPLEFAA